MSILLGIWNESTQRVEEWNDKKEVRLPLSEKERRARPSSRTRDQIDISIDSAVIDSGFLVLSLSYNGESFTRTIRDVPENIVKLFGNPRRPGRPKTKAN